MMMGSGRAAPVRARVVFFGFLVAAVAANGAAIAASPASARVAKSTSGVVGVAPDLEKTFLETATPPGGTATIRFSLTLPESASTPVTAITFSDDLDAMLSGATAVNLPLSDVCGAGSAVTGTTTVAFGGGSLSPGESCSFDVAVSIPPGVATGLYTNLTSNVGADAIGVPVASAAAGADLLVSGLGISKAFLDDPVVPGGSATLQFTISNAAAIEPATAIAFTDDLDGMLSGTVATGLPMNDVCGPGSQLSGSGVITLSSGSLAAGASCTFSVVVQTPVSAASTDYSNVTSQLSAEVNLAALTLDPARDSLTIDSELLALSKSFVDDPVMPGDTVTLQFTLTNESPGATADSISFTDNLGAALSGLVAVGLPMNDVCGAGSQVSGSGVLTLSGGILAGGASCTFAVTLQVPAGASVGDMLNTTSSVTGQIGGQPVTGGPASDTLQVRALTFSKAYSGYAEAGSTVQLSFSITNLDQANGISGLGFTDDLDASLSGLVALGLPQSDVCGAGSQISGSNLLVMTGGDLPPGGSCVVTVTVQVPPGTALDTYPNITSELFVQGLPVGPPASADLLVEAPPAFQKAFSPSTVDVGQSSTLTFSIDNTLNNADTSSLAFTDNLPAGMLIAAVPNVSTSCVGGIITAAPGAGVITYSGGSVAAGVGCSVQVDVAASAVGSLVNTTGDLTSDKGNSGVANATLTVLEAPLFGKAFAPATVALGAVSTLSFSIDNSANVVDATGLDFTDNLPTGMVVATPANASTTCTGGTLTAASGATVVSYSGGTAPASASCSLQVDVEAQAAGTLNNTTGDLTSSAGNSGPASASLTVSAAEISISKAFSATSVLRGGLVDVTYTIENLSTSATVDNISFTEDFSVAMPGWIYAGLPLPGSGVCGMTGTMGGSGSVVSLILGSLAPGESCTLPFQLMLPANAPLGLVTSTSSAVTGTVFGNPIAGNTASDDLTVVWLGFTKAFVYSGSPVPGSDIGLMFSISNPDPLNAVSGITFSDDLGAAVPGMFANGLPMSGICGAGSQIAGSSVVTLSNGSIAAGGSCSFQISVHIPNSISAGTYTNNTSPLTATPAGGLASSGDPADIASASIALPSGVPAPIVAPNVIPTLDPRWLLAMMAMFALIAGFRIRQQG